MNSGIRSDPPDGSQDSRAVTVIRREGGWKLLDLGEFWRYRDLLVFLTRRNIKVRYAQSALGIGWAVIQPLFFMIVFSIVFGRLVGVSSDGVPYAIFSFTALVPFTFFSNALTESTNSLLANSGMFSKIYFPRMVMPLSAVLAKLLDFAIAFVLLIGLMAWYGKVPSVWAVAIPLLMMIMVLTSLGLGTLLTALAIQYRDVKYGVAFLSQLLMYAAPVVYPVSLIPDKYRLIYGLNPMVGVIEGFRSALLKSADFPIDLVLVGGLVSIVMLIVGVLYFRRTEHLFADVV